MNDYFKPDLGSDPDNPFARDGEGKLVRRTYWLDMTDKSLILAMTQGVGGSLSNEQKRLHMKDLGKETLIDQICIQEVIPPSP